MKQTLESGLPVSLWWLRLCHALCGENGNEKDGDGVYGNGGGCDHGHDDGGGYDLGRDHPAALAPLEGCEDDDVVVDDDDVDDHH